jgi:cell wall-associated NlpC family hydrolase
MADLDLRITPARGDIAAAHLEGQVEAKRFVTGERLQVGTSSTSVRKLADAGSEQVNQALFGETFMVYERTEGWAWGQLETDGYVGFMALDRLVPLLAAPTHRVSAISSLVFERPDLKSPVLMALSMTTPVAVEDEQRGFAKIAGSGWLFMGHLAQRNAFEADFVTVAERFVGAPYLWGGRGAIGLDCSGLVQTALAAAGIAAPRDSDMQAAQLGAAIDPGEGFAGLRRGDLVFWPGHVGIMRDGERLIHVNAWYMAIDAEKLADAVARIRPVAGEIRAVRRLSQMFAGAGS